MANRPSPALWLVCVCILFCGIGISSASADDRPKIDNARLNYTINCQGCHKEDGAGEKGFIPPLRGQVAKFLATPDGRAFLIRVPGVAQSMLDDRQLAEMLNWLIPHFDRANMPANFAPYTAAEIRAYRARPISRTITAREEIVASIPALRDAR